jgi:phage protein D
VTESTQGTSDSATFTLDDRDYLLEVPTKGKIITVQMGYKETGLVNVGEFMVDQVRHKDSQAASFDITARAQKHRDTPVKVRVVRPWDESTLFTIINKIAGRSGYTAKVDPDVATFFYDHLDQNESDAQFLQRLAVLHDCYVKYENNQLVFWKRDNTVGDITVSRGAGGTTGVSLTATSSCRNEYTGAKLLGTIATRLKPFMSSQERTVKCAKFCRVVTQTKPKQPLPLQVNFRDCAEAPVRLKALRSPEMQTFAPGENCI